MVNTIDINKLNLEELSGVVSLYPWFAQARVELCARLGESGACSEAQLEASALYVPSRRKLYSRTRGESGADYSDADVEKLIRTYITSKESENSQPRIIIAGSDFFSTDQYRSVAGVQEKIEFRPGAAAGTASEGATKASGGAADHDIALPEICSETLAGIYLEQGYPEEAKKIYSKLILRYPEKSVYFAALIEKINRI